MINIKGIQIKSFEVDHDNVDEVNMFLEEYDGNIIDIKIIPLLYGKSRYVVIYRGIES